jgi:hypothetical protein
MCFSMFSLWCSWCSMVFPSFADLPGTSCGNCRPRVAPQLGDRFSTSVCTWCREQNRPQLTVILMGLLKKRFCSWSMMV